VCGAPRSIVKEGCEHEEAGSSSNEEGGSRATLLEDILSKLIEVEDMLLELELKDSVRPLTIKETRLYKEVRARLRELITELTNDLAREHSAA
jgi:hypothetical protein